MPSTTRRSVASPISPHLAPTQHNPLAYGGGRSVLCLLMFAILVRVRAMPSTARRSAASPASSPLALTQHNFLPPGGGRSAFHLLALSTPARVREMPSTTWHSAVSPVSPPLAPTQHTLLPPDVGCPLVSPVATRICIRILSSSASSLVTHVDSANRLSDGMSSCAPLCCGDAGRCGVAVIFKGQCPLSTGILPQRQVGRAQSCVHW